MEEEVKQPPVAPAPAAPVPAKRRTFVRRLFAWALRTALASLTLTALGSAALAWRLSQGPINAAPVIPYIEKLMGDPERLRFDIGSMTLSWRGKSDPFSVQMSDVHLLGPKGEFMTVSRVDLGLSPWRLLLAHMHFTYAKVQNLSVRIIRLPDGAITMTGLENTDGAKPEQSVKLEMSNIISDLPSIEKLSLSDMRVVFEDQKDALIRRFDDVDMEVTQNLGFRGRSVAGYMTTTLTGINDGSLVALDFIYDADDRMLTSSVRLDRADTRKLIGGVLRAANLPVIDMLVQGRAEVRLKNDFSLDSLALKLQGDDGMLHWPRNYGKGLEDQKLTKFELDVGFDPKTQALEVSNATITIKGITLTTRAKVSAKKGWDSLTGEASAEIPVVAVDALPAVWPKVWDSGARHWLVENMDKGRFSKVSVNVPFEAKRKPAPQAPEDDPAAEEEYVWDIKTGTIKGSFGFTGVTVDYRPPMLPAANVTGTGIYEGLSLTLNFEKASIGRLNVTQGRLYFDDLITAGTGHADLHLLFKGPVASVFEYLEKEPISYRRKVSIDGSKARGTAEVDAQVDFPTTKDMKVEDVHVKAVAKLHDLSMPDAVKGMTLAGPDFTLEASENHFRIEGTGSLEGRPAKLMWHELFSAKPSDPFAAKLEADLSTDKVIRRRFIGALEDRVDGIIPATVSMLTKPDGMSKIEVKAKLDDARIDFTNPFNAVKEAGVPATAHVTGTLKDGYIQGLDSITATGAGITIGSGAITFARDAAGDPVLETARLSGLRLGNTHADISATWKGEHNIKASVTGRSFDARWIMDSDSKTSGNKTGNAETPTAYDVDLKVGTLYVADTPIENVTAAFVGNADGTVRVADLTGAAGGQPVTLKYMATGGAGDRLSWQAADAGAALAAFGVTERVRGGTLDVQAAPISGGQAGDMQGTLLLKHFSVLKAPMLVKLVNFLSLPGLLSILSQDTGLKFERAESELTWLNRPGGALARFTDGRTSGSSLGLTFEGEVNTATDVIAIQGTAVPLSEINSVLSHIPLVGDILTGGGKGGGIFAATYTMKGNAADPDVMVNPLSVLTPGILRRILFEGGVPKADKPAAPARPRETGGTNK